MTFREATTSDIKEIRLVRNSVKENTQSDPNLVTDQDCETFITKRGKRWVCEIDSRIAGFSIVDCPENNIWAQFMSPEFEKMGIGKKLHDMMPDCYFTQTNEPVWLDRNRDLWKGRYQI